MKLLGVAIVFAVFAKSLCHNFNAPEVVVSNPTRPVASSLAVGGMIHGLLDMQIRPQGGFFEEKYKTIFSHDTAPLPASPNTKSKSYISSEKILLDRISEDGRLLKEASIGQSPNPCFEAKRIVHNPLLGLLCKLQQRNAWNKVK